MVTDFDITRDRLDLSEFEGSWDLQDLQVFSRSWGAELIYHGEVFEIRSLDGSSLDASDFGPAQFALFLDRVTPTPIEPGSGHLVGGSGPDLLIGSIEGTFWMGQAAMTVSQAAVVRILYTVAVARISLWAVTEMTVSMAVREMTSFMAMGPAV
nr:hypothetical protein [Parasedimentitalea marina]